MLATLALAISIALLTAAPASAAPPTLETGAATPSYVSADVTGTVDPADEEVSYRFQYSTNPAVEGWNFSTFPRQIPAGSGPTTVSDNFHGGFCEIEHCEVALKPGTTYVYRLVATNNEGEFSSAQPYDEFTPLAVTPPVIASANDATEITNRTAKVTGSIERGAEPDDPSTEVDCRVEYITNGAFGPRDEVQRLAIAATGGTYTLKVYEPRLRVIEASGPVPFDASDAEVQAALQGLSSIGPGAVNVTGAGAGLYDLNYAGSLEGRNVEQVFVDSSGLTDATTAEVTTTAEGHMSFEGGGSAPCVPNQLATPGTTQVLAPLTGLLPNTIYHLRLTASNAGGSSSQVLSNFTTTVALTAQTLGAGAIGPSSATLTGRVNPENAPITYQFEWGLTPTYTAKAPVSPEPLGFLDESPHVVSAPVSALSPATTYHYRLVATNTLTAETFVGEDRLFTTPALPTSQACPNESSRTGFSAGLPDCRAFEFATPDLNSVKIAEGGTALPDGSAILFRTTDPPSHADGVTLENKVVGRRDSKGWSTKSLAPALPEPVASYLSTETWAVSADFSESVSATTQPLAGPGSPSDGNLYLRDADGTYFAMTKVGSPYVEEVNVYGTPFGPVYSADFSHFYYISRGRQLPEDPLSNENLYEWSKQEGLHLVGVLPDGTLAPQGAQLATNFEATSTAALPPTPANGRFVIFAARPVQFEEGGGGTANELFLREPGQPTRAIGKSQRFNDPDLNPSSTLRAVGVTSDGSEILFLSHSELTEDAYTGRSPAGVATDAGSDLYSYDVASGDLADLTVDNDPADKATGANVKQVSAATPDGSYLYFSATGKLAPGGVSGENNFYVEHEGAIDYIAPTPGNLSSSATYLTPDGKHLAFTSNLSLTGYDSGGLDQTFVYSYRRGIVCASCRPSGDSPTDPGPSFPVLSDDGTRLFFQSQDAVIPQASNGLVNVFEYSDGIVRLISPGDTDKPVRLLDASASGDDVFVVTNAELTPGAGTTSAIYDARVNADTFEPVPSVCQGEGCRGAGSAAPGASAAGSAGLEAPGELVVPGSKVTKAPKLRLRINVPATGLVVLSGNGVESVRKKATEPGPLTLTVALKSWARKKRSSKGVFRTKVSVSFSPNSQVQARKRTATVSLAFEGSAKKRGN